MADETQTGTKARKSAAEQRAERLKAALRDNLRKRKAQMRGRSAPVDGSEESSESGA